MSVNTYESPEVTVFSQVKVVEAVIGPVENPADTVKDSEMETDFEYAAEHEATSQLIRSDTVTDFPNNWVSLVSQ